MRLCVEDRRAGNEDALLRASLDKLVGSPGVDRIVLVLDDTRATPPLQVRRGVRVLRFSVPGSLDLGFGCDGAEWLCGGRCHYLMPDRPCPCRVHVGRRARRRPGWLDLDANFVAHNSGDAEPGWLFDTPPGAPQNSR